MPIDNSVIVYQRRRQTKIFVGLAHGKHRSATLQWTIGGPWARPGWSGHGILPPDAEHRVKTKKMLVKNLSFPKASNLNVLHSLLWFTNDTIDDRSLVKNY